MDLERDLRTLELAWPETPELRLELAPRARRRRRPLLVAVALALAALAAALAVPQSRGSILRFLHLGGVTIERVDQLPAARERPLGAGLGPVVTQAQAREALRHALVLPPLAPPPPLHLEQGVVSLVFADRGEPVLLSELNVGSDAAILKKVVGGSTSVVSLQVDGGPGFWIAGEHVFLFPSAPPRLAGNVLLWQAHGLTLRLEGRALTLARARELAGLLRKE